uniref:Uncharacterized protein n=1 Tax=Helianthus annuus TaxID=4232 RepID=A0A251SFH4_HELAN
MIGPVSLSGKEESGAVEIAGRRRLSCFQLQKVWRFHFIYPNNKVLYPENCCKRITESRPNGRYTERSLSIIRSEFLSPLSTPRPPRIGRLNINRKPVSEAVVEDDRC